MEDGNGLEPPAITEIEPGEATRWSEAEGRPFRFAGRWWTFDIEGRLGVWDADIPAP